MHDDYSYHIYKKGKKKNTLKFYKNRKEVKKNNNDKNNDLKLETKVKAVSMMKLKI